MAALYRQFLPIRRWPNRSTKRLRKLAFREFGIDEIVEVTAKPYPGFVYNMTTDSGNYLIDFVLTHNYHGLGTPAHLRVESGSVHKANKGVLYIDEIANLEPRAQQELLTSTAGEAVLITGQSEMSSGALVKTEPAPCDFVLVAAGNVMDIQKMHPALRSRIRGYGYEVYMESVMDDNREEQRVTYTVHSPGDQEGREDTALRLQCHRRDNQRGEKEGRPQEAALVQGSRRNNKGSGRSCRRKQQKDRHQERRGERKISIGFD